MTTFTPGPWIAAGSEITPATWVKGSDNRRICTMRQSDCDWANARLIAEAPAMANELRESAEELDAWMLEQAPSADDFDKMRSRFRAILARIDA